MINELSVANGKDPSNISNLTKDQLKAYEGLMNFINRPYDEKDYKRALIGSAGVGKTYLLKAIIKNCNYSYSSIGVAAPSHKACRVLKNNLIDVSIKVNTVQSDFGLRLNFNVEDFDINNPPFDPKGEVKIDKYSLYIIDEASMINKGLLKFIESYTKRNRCKVIYVGDDHQLSPVNEMTSEAFNHVKSYRLNQIVRQEEDNPIRPLLDMLRKDIDNRTYNFLNYIIKHRECFDNNYLKGYKVLSSKDFTKEVYKQFSDEYITKDTDFIRIVAYTNKAVGAWNKVVRNSIIADAEKSPLTKNDLITSYVTIVDEFNDPIIKNSEDYIIHDIVNYVHPTYNLKGFMVKFQSIHGGNITSPLFVIDHTDSFSVSLYCKLSDKYIKNAKTASKLTRGSKWRDYYKFKESCLLLINIGDAEGNIKYTRDLDYGFAQTSHKSQGSTYDTVMVDINDIVFDKYGNAYTDAREVNKRLYVAVSRCKNKCYMSYGV